ncbi:hypothetical protein, partial [Fischerella thermalis]|uniref:hypothetical protein n=1 Tax=Fischerella thermalis TaxID=372787 RepID=UPI000CCAF83D
GVAFCTDRRATAIIQKTRTIIVSRAVKVFMMICGELLKQRLSPHDYRKVVIIKSQLIFRQKI